MERKMEKDKVKKIVIGSAVAVVLVFCLVIMIRMTSAAKKPDKRIVGVWQGVVDNNDYIVIDKNGKAIRYNQSDNGVINYASKGKAIGYSVRFTRCYNSFDSDKVYVDLQDVKYKKVELPEVVEYKDEDTVYYYPLQEDDGKSELEGYIYKRLK